jgi:hypothetical protein
MNDIRKVAVMQGERGKVVVKEKDHILVPFCKLFLEFWEEGKEVEIAVIPFQNKAEYEYGVAWEVSFDGVDFSIIHHKPQNVLLFVTDTKTLILAIERDGKVGIERNLFSLLRQGNFTEAVGYVKQYGADNDVVFAS